MKTVKMLTIFVLSLVVWQAKVSEAAPMGTAFTYQGRLMDANDAADGLYDFQFKLFDDPNTVTGNQLGTMIDINDLDVIDGYFTAELNFGSSVFDGNSVWLEIDVRPGDSNDPNAFVSLSPRQEITAVPYALQTRGIFVDNAGRVGIGTTNPQATLEVNGSIKATVKGTVTFMVAAHNAPDDVKNVADYVCDGTDDQVQVQAAVDNLLDKGGKIYLSEGWFNFSDTLHLYRSGLTGRRHIHLEGSHIRSTIIALVDNSNCDLIDVVVDSSRCAGWIVLRNLYLFGNKTNNTSGRGFYYTAPTGLAYDLLIDGLFTSQCADQSIYITNGHHALITNSWIEQAGGDALYLAGSECRISDCLFTASGGHGLWLSGHSHVVNNCIIRGLGANAVYLINCYNSTFTNLYIRKWGEVSPYQEAGIKIQQTGGTAENLLFSNIFIDGEGDNVDAYYGIRLSNGVHCQFSNINIQGTSHEPVKIVSGANNNIFSGCYFEAGANTGEKVSDSGSGNQFLNCHGSGIDTGVIQDKNGNVGIGTTNPSEKLDVEGNIDVSSNQIKHYYGFPRHDYDSGWQPINQGQIITLTHSLGGNVDNYVVDMQSKDTDFGGITSYGHGGDTSALNYYGVYWEHLTTSQIKVFRQAGNPSEYVRIRIWVYD